jgi:protein-disulfide isomerase
MTKTRDRAFGSLVFVAILSLGLLAQSSKPAIALIGPVPITEKSKGSPKAKVTVIEYASVTCVHCAEWKKNVWPEFEKKYVKTGQVRYVFREIATSPTPIALGVYMLGHCAAHKATKAKSQAYFSIIDGFFSEQAKVFETREVLPTLQSLSQKAGLNEAEMQACINNEALYKDIETRMEALATKDKIEGTPTFLVNGKKTNGNEMVDLDRAIAAALKSR